MRIVNVLSNLKKGYETRNVSLLLTCFNPVPPLQADTYKNLFAAAENFKVDIDIGAIKYNTEFASAEAKISESFDVIGSNGTRIPKNFSKSVAYLLKKTEGKWFIGSILDYSKVGGSLKVTPNNVGSLNQTLQKIQATNSVGGNGLVVNASRNKVFWAANPGASQYVTSLADRDLTKDPVGNLLWKAEKIRDAFAFLPSTAISAMTPSKTYYLHVFAYDTAGSALTGEVIQVVRID